MDQDTVRRCAHTAAGAAVLALFLTAAACDRTAPTPAPAPAVSAGIASWAPASTLPDDVHVAWAYLDSTEGDTRAGGDTDLHPLDHLVVPGIAADYLDQRGDQADADDNTLVTAALAGDHDAGERLTKKAGGVDDPFTRVIDACALDDTRMSPPRATALATARYAACLREGAIADPPTSTYVLDKMRGAAGGIGDVRGNDGGQRLAQFNSTEPAGDGRARTGCLGVGAYWSAAVLVDFPAGRGDLYGVAVCAEVARAQFPPDTQQAPESNSPTPTTTS